jgi:hypothetical protein
MTMLADWTLGSSARRCVVVERGEIVWGSTGRHRNRCGRVWGLAARERVAVVMACAPLGAALGAIDPPALLM